MTVATFQQQLDSFLLFATEDVLIWHDSTGAAPQLIELAELPSDVVLYTEQSMSRFELLCSLNDISPDERALVIRTHRKRIEENDWFADLEARADSFEPDLGVLPRREHSILNRALHALKREQDETRWKEEARHKHEEKTHRREANRQAWCCRRYGIDAPGDTKPVQTSLVVYEDRGPDTSPASAIPPTLTEAWYKRDTFFSALAEAGIEIADDNEEAVAASAGYMLFNDCAIRGVFSSPADYYRTLFTAPLPSHNDIPHQELQASPSFKSFLISAQTAGTVFEYDDETWITSAGLQELGIKRQDLDSFAQQAVARSVATGIPQFTVPWLRANAPDLSLLAYGLSDVFYESVLLTRRRYVTRGHLGGRRIFAEPHTQARGRDLIESILKLETSIDIDCLYDILHDDYGIGITHTQIVQLVRATSLLYSPELERIYVTHDQFIREVE